MFSFSSVSKKGSRSINEDAVGIFCAEKKFGCIVCDGLGGHGLGDAASSHVVSCFETCFGASEAADFAFLEEMFKYAQRSLMNEQQSRGAQNRMKTTAVAVVSDGKNLYAGHIGDSRLYIFSGNKIIKRTIDHSLPQILALSGEIKDSEIRKHPDRNKLLKAMGTEWEKPMYTLSDSFPISELQAFLLCTDGFWELIEDEQMCALLEESKNADEWLKKMTEVVERDEKNKSMDNYSAIVGLKNNKILMTGE